MKKEFLDELGLIPIWRKLPNQQPQGSKEVAHDVPTGPESQMTTLEDMDWTLLEKTAKSCEKCKLRSGCQQVVFGVGDQNADWLFIGEGPGAEEDARGEPFVGRAGKLLDNILLAMGFSRSKKIYIANIVKCRPPNNRDPEPEEIHACTPYLLRQIELIRPKIIITLGRVAAQTLLENEAPLSALRKKVHEFHKIPLVATYHPAYLLRSPKEKRKVWEDLCFAQHVSENAPGTVAKLPASKSLL